MDDVDLILNFFSWKEVGNVAKRLRAVDADMDIVLRGAFANAETSK